MTKEEFFKSNLFKVFLVMVIAVGIIKIATAGYVTGQWLHSITH
jgi:hypothetical protein